MAQQQNNKTCLFTLVDKLPQETFGIQSIYNKKNNCIIIIGSFHNNNIYMKYLNNENNQEWKCINHYPNNIKPSEHNICEINNNNNDHFIYSFDHFHFI